MRAGVVFALISGEDSPLVDRFARKMGITCVEKHCKDKSAALQRFSENNGIALSAISYMGDDVNDLGAMNLAGLAATPSDAHPAARRCAAFIASRAGGYGAVRELIDAVLAAKAAAV
jgi:3-deoxy-D-manno-octulosonate 8-phosphate phosphatase (KDO 8-P phosphatase)